MHPTGDLEEKALALMRPDPNRPQILKFKGARNPETKKLYTVEEHRHSKRGGGPPLGTTQTLTLTLTLTLA